MTLDEIAKKLKLRNDTVIKAVKSLCEKDINFRNRFVIDKIYFKSEFSLEETKRIYKELGCNLLQITTLEETWKGDKLIDVFTIKGTQNFLEEYKKNPKKSCCNNCKYLKGCSVEGLLMPQPYCSVYQRLLKDINAKVYEDWCSSYVYANLPKPRQWYKENAPVNLNMYGETNTVNGINREELNKTRESNEKIKIVNKVGF